MSESEGLETPDTEAPAIAMASPARQRERRTDRSGVPYWKAEEKERTVPKSEEIAKLWMNENSIVNQKAAYFTAVNGALFISLKDIIDPWIAITLCWIGMGVCIVAFVSIARTCAYRSWLRHALEVREDYCRFFVVDFPWPWQRVKSSYLLTTVPLAGVVTWLYFGHLKVKALNVHVWFPCLFDWCWK